MIIDMLTLLEKYFLSLMGVSTVILSLMIWKLFRGNFKTMMVSFVLAGILGFLWKFILIFNPEEGIYATIAELSEAGFMVFTTVAVFTWVFTVREVFEK
jgi:hypothetical protein